MRRSRRALPGTLRALDLVERAGQQRAHRVGAAEVQPQCWPSIPAVPTMSAGATDRRFLRNIGIPTFGHSGLAWISTAKGSSKPASAT
jgi:hypothetical protein